MYKRYAEEVRARSNVTSPAPNALPSSLKQTQRSTAPNSVPVATAEKRGSDARPLERKKSTSCDKDVMISYSHQNRPFMRKLKGKR